MIKFREYLPTFYEGFTPRAYECSSLAKLLATPYVAGWKKNTLETFTRYTLADDKLMVDLKDGKEWWVIGYIDLGALSPTERQELDTLPLPYFKTLKPTETRE